MKTARIAKQPLSHNSARRHNGENVPCTEQSHSTKLAATHRMHVVFGLLCYGVLAGAHMASQSSPTVPLFIFNTSSVES